MFIRVGKKYTSIGFSVDAVGPSSVSTEKPIYNEIKAYISKKHSLQERERELQCPEELVYPP